MSSGWQCPGCKVYYSPEVRRCECAKLPTIKPYTPSRGWDHQCDCPPNGICMNAACPRRTMVTYGGDYE